MQQRTGPPDGTEIERHWDQVCLGLAAIGTAVMAAVFLISGIAEERTDPIRLIETVKYADGGLLTGPLTYGRLRLVGKARISVGGEIPPARQAAKITVSFAYRVWQFGNLVSRASPSRQCGIPCAGRKGARYARCGPARLLSPSIVPAADGNKPPNPNAHTPQLQPLAPLYAHQTPFGASR